MKEQIIISVKKNKQTNKQNKTKQKKNFDNAGQIISKIELLRGTYRGPVGHGIA